MITDPVAAFSSIVVLAVACQWLAQRTQIPSVLLLLVAGVAMGTVVDPDTLLGDLFFPVVALGVAVLLFEGGLSLRWHNLGQAARPVFRLVTIGLVATWIVGTVAAALVLDIDLGVALVVGAILTVSGPTVIGPILRTARLREPDNSILRWEGILIDPIGAGLAVIVLDAVLEDRGRWQVALRVVTTFGAGVAVGSIVAGVVLLALRRYLVPDNLQVAVTLASLMAAFAIANQLRPDAGLLAATVLGIAFANQRGAAARHITEFSEHLGALVLGGLVIILAARVDVGEAVDHLWPSLLIIAALVVIARPLGVAISTAGSATTWRERTFLMSIAPRGVVAASVASLFAVELEENGIDPGPMVAVVFTVVVGTVALSALSARILGGRLRVIKPTPAAVAVIGGHRFGLDLAQQLASVDVVVLMIGLDDDEKDEAARRQLLVYDGRLDTEDFLTTVESVGVSQVVAVSGLDHLDAYVTERLSEAVGRAHVFALTAEGDADGADPDAAIAPRRVLPAHLTPQRLDSLLANGRSLRRRPQGAGSYPGWITICSVNADGQVDFGSEGDADGQPADTWLVQIGPLADKDQFEPIPSPSDED